MEIVNIVLSSASFLLSIFALIFSLRAQGLQNKVNELEIQIKQNELNNIERQKAKDKDISLEAQVIHVVKSKFKLRISNIGERTAYNVNAKIIEGEVTLLDTGLTPYDILESKNRFDLTIVSFISASRKFRVLITWQDEKGKEFSKEQFCSLT